MQKPQRLRTHRKINSGQRIATAAFLSLLSLTSIKADETWANTNNSGDWATAANWNNTAVPNSADNVIILGTTGSPGVFSNGGGGGGTTFSALSITVDGYELNPTNASHFVVGNAVQIGGARDSQLVVSDAASSITASGLTLAGGAGTNNAVDLVGALNVGTGNIVIGNAVDHSDFFTVNAGASLTAGAIQIGSSGQLDFQNTGNFTASTPISSLTTGGIISSSNSSTVTLSGDGSGFKGAFVLSGDGASLDIANAGYLAHATSFTYSTGSSQFEIGATGTTSSASTMVVGSNHGFLDVDNGIVFTHAGTLTGASNNVLTVIGGGSTILTGNSEAFAGVIITSGGNIEIASGANFGDPTSAQIEMGTGSFKIDGGGIASFLSVFNFGGLLQVNGTLNVGPGNSILVQGPQAILAGTGEINSIGATLVVGSSMNPGGTITAGNYVPLSASSVSASDIGNLTINANLQLNSDATTIIKVAGTTHGNNAAFVPGVDYDHLTINGSSQLGGTLIIQAGSGVIRGGDKFDIITSTGGFAGDFAAVNILNNALTFTTSIVNTGMDYELSFVATQQSFSSFAGTPNQAAVASALDTQYANLGNTPLVVALDSIPGTELPGAFNQLMPLKFGTFASSTAFNNTSFTLQQFDSYLANHRGADGTFVSSQGGLDYSGLAINDPNIDTGLQSVRSRLLAWSPAPSTGLLSDSGNLVLGGMDMKDAVIPSGPTNLWNVFVTGNVVLAQDFSNANAGLPYASATTGGVQIGADYKITPHWLVGATFGYGHTNATLDTIGSNANVNTYSPGVYTSYSSNGWYANALGSYGFADYSQNRNVSIGAFNGTAHSAPGGGQIVGNLDGGYDFHKGNWTFGPTLGLQYVHLNVDGYTETGLPGADLAVNENESNSLRSRLGGQVSYAVKSGSMVFTPHLSASWQHEFMDQSRGITSQFSDVGVGAGSFVVNTPNPSRESALADVGLDAQVNNALTVFTDYSVQAGQSNYFGQSVQAGVKIGF